MACAALLRRSAPAGTRRMAGDLITPPSPLLPGTPLLHADPPTSETEDAADCDGNAPNVAAVVVAATPAPT
jgi:hypothetical protein